MVRTGRFGRLPTEAPDLSGQIVSLMEQWMNAEDRNILDAWTNGGKYKGKKVTDGQILNHYRKRRDSYEKDDPEWDEWNQDLWQMRYQISDEKVQMAYRMGRIGPAAVAAHYRSWARKMPKDSSYYRNLMATAGDFAKAAKAAQQAAGSAFDYEAMMKHINGLDRQLKPTEDFFTVVNEYAISRGLITPGQDIRDPGVLTSWEAADLNALLDGVTEDPAWERRLGNRIDFKNEGGVRGRITSERIDDMVQRAVRLRREKIRTYQRAPYDMSGYIKAERDAIRDIRAYGNLARQRGVLDVGSYLSTAFDIWTGSPNERVSADQRKGEDGRMGAIDPIDSMSGDPSFADALRRAVKDYKRLGMTGEAAAAEALYKAVTMRDEAEMNDWLQTLDPAIVTNAFGGAFSEPGAIAQFAREQLTLRNAVELMNSGQAVISYDLPSPGGAEQALGEAARLPYRILAIERRPDGVQVVKDAANDQSWVMDATSEIVPVMGSNGQMMPAIVRAKEVRNPQNQVVGYRLDIPHSSAQLWGGADPDNPGVINWVAYNPWESQTGTTLVDSGEYVQMVVDNDTAQQAAESGAFEAPVLDLTITESVEQFLDALAEDDTLTPEQKEEREVAVRQVESDLNESDWPNILADPAKLAAYMELNKADFVSVEQFRGQTRGDGIDMGAEATLAAARESMRNRYGWDVPEEASDMRYFTPEGYVRTAMDASGLPDGALEEQVRQRKQIVDTFGEGTGYGQGLAQYRQANGGAVLAGGAAYDLTGDAYGLTTAPTDTAAQPVDDATALQEVDPIIQQERRVGNHTVAAERLAEDAFKSGSSSAALVVAMADANLRKAMKDDPNTFMNVASLGVNSQAEADGLAQDYASAWALGAYAPELAILAGKGASGAAVDMGRMMGIERNLQTATTMTSESIGGRTPWAPLTEPEARQVSEGFGALYGGRITRGTLMGSDPGTARADEMVVQPRETTQPVKPQPSMKLSGTLANMVMAPAQAVVDASKQVIKVASMPGPVSLPGPVKPMQPVAPPPPPPSNPVPPPSSPVKPMSPTDKWAPGSLGDRLGIPNPWTWTR